MRAAVILALLLAAPATAQRAEDNIVTAATDAFGASIGRESIGLYDEGNVRGFSPETAGNIRIEGLYFDRRAFMTGRVRQGSTIHVGLTALDFLFPAPTGIADVSLYRAGAKPLLTLTTGVEPVYAPYAEAELQLPLADTLGATIGTGLYHDHYPNGGRGLFFSNAVTLRWNPAPGVEITPFWSQSDASSQTFGPLYAPAGDFLPQPVDRARYFGPRWAVASFLNSNYGLLAKADLGNDFRLESGLFRSIVSNRRTFGDLITGITPDGRGRQLIFADPPTRNASLSGEARLSKSFLTGAIAHRLHLSLRGRGVEQSFGGNDTLDLGPVTINTPSGAPAPAGFRFGTPTQDRVRQGTVGLAWEARWAGVGQLALGLQRSDYRKTVRLPGTAPVITRASPWLWNASLALTPTPRLTLYAGATRGLEENGIAPADAANRNAALPALETRQVDAGLRLALTKDLTLLAGLFSITKPYFARDPANLFTRQGDVRHRGAELSLSGSLAPGLTLVTGALFLDSSVSGPAVAGGAIGRRPVGRARFQGQLNLDWRPAPDHPWSFDAGLFHNSSTMATLNNRVSVPAVTTLDAGVRYRAKLGTRPVTLRVQALNLTNRFAWEVIDDGLYDVNTPRTVQFSITADI
ncbi:TonB-dependent receptor domain-containing protein [Sandaracinobacteroides saxicola]|uniref:TonB-dependent receptor n=1 Tax=Sandaracinobacteroides saxicola TaxID=2759707 RepID=A0A7G5IH52_9SPHN|nr:TonB-dependent receptor [Sandaracinobacteroides saxicola]QMW22694.1 TonB-dependent receptor [Sandaracinobacteroides saxicola]